MIGAMRLQPPDPGRVPAEPGGAPPAESDPRAASRRLAEQGREGGEMAHDPRGGWRFATPADERAHGPDAPPPPLDVLDEPDPSERPESTDAERLRLGADAQHPPQSFPHGGTQGTWDLSLGEEPVPEPPARLLTDPDAPSPAPPVPHTFLPHTPGAVPAADPHAAVVPSPERPEGL